MDGMTVAATPPIEIATQELHNSIRELDQNIKALIDSVSPVLGKSHEDGGEAGREPSPESQNSTVFLWLKDETAFVDELSATVRAVNRRVEV